MNLAAPVLITLTLLLSTARADVAKLDEETRAKLKAEFKEMLASDQSYRSMLSWRTTDPDELARLQALPDDEQIEAWRNRLKNAPELPAATREEFNKKQQEIDKKNEERLREIVTKYGWPDEKRFGEDFSVEVILIHGGVESVLAMKPMLKREVLAGRLKAKKFAAIIDRKLQHAGKIQLYGMSSAFDRETGKVLPPLIENIEKTNAARKEIGMPPLEKYRTE